MVVDECSVSRGSSVWFSLAGCWCMSMLTMVIWINGFMRMVVRSEWTLSWELLKGRRLIILFHFSSLRFCVYLLKCDWTCIFLFGRLAYLHEGLEPRFVHLDVKSSNILLDCQWNAKVSDFGLAKLLCSENSYVTTRVMGTFGLVSLVFLIQLFHLLFWSTFCSVITIRK